MQFDFEGINNAEGVRQFEPGVRAQARTLGIKIKIKAINPERVRRVRR